ncbi:MULTISPECIES: alpha/beta hydrolase [unclassified Streptomyces]|uniref:alpha/beta fold hydrolase n=1 Tax=unclassified Streptomyces TaxID=2593676 RepID=UPI0033D505B6
MAPTLLPAAVPLLILGGGFQDRHSWSRLERRIGHLHPLLIPDLPPAHPPDGPQLTWADLTQAALQTVDHSGLGHFAALGGSSGYPIAYRLAQQHPDRVTHVLLFGASPRPATSLTALIDDAIHQRALPVERPARTADPGLPPAASQLQDTARDQAARGLVDILTNARAGRECVPIRAAARILRTQLATAPYDPIARYISDRGRLLLDAPLPEGRINNVRGLVGVGEHDTVTTIGDNRAVAATIDDVTFTVVRDADHLLHLEQDAEFANIVTRFLTNRALLPAQST